MRIVLTLFGLAMMGGLAFAATLDLEPHALTAKTYDPVSILNTANQLIALGEEGAYRSLRKYAKEREFDPGFDRSQYVAWLCLLLYKEKTAGDLPKPGFGAPDFPLPIDNASWPLFPLAFSHGVPFLLVSGYDLAGNAYPDSYYVEEYHKKGAFRDKPYAVPSKAEAQAALEGLLKSKVWKALAWGRISPAQTPYFESNKIEWLQAQVNRVR